MAGWIRLPAYARRISFEKFPALPAHRRISRACAYTSMALEIGAQEYDAQFRARELENLPRRAKRIGMKLALIFHVLHVKYQPLASTRPLKRACSGLSFQRVEGLILSKAYFTPRRNFGCNILQPKRIFHKWIIVGEICGLVQAA